MSGLSTLIYCVFAIFDDFYMFWISHRLMLVGIAFSVIYTTYLLANTLRASSSLLRLVSWA